MLNNHKTEHGTPCLQRVVWGIVILLVGVFAAVSIAPLVIAQAPTGALTLALKEGSDGMTDKNVLSDHTDSDNLQFTVTSTANFGEDGARIWLMANKAASCPTNPTALADWSAFVAWRDGFQFHAPKRLSGISTDNSHTIGSLLLRTQRGDGSPLVKHLSDGTYCFVAIYVPLATTAPPVLTSIGSTVVKIDTKVATPIVALKTADASTPTFTVRNLEVGATAQLFSDATCSTSVSAESAAITSGDRVDIQTSALTTETTIYAKTTDKVGNVSACSDGVSREANAPAPAPSDVYPHPDTGASDDDRITSGFTAIVVEFPIGVVPHPERTLPDVYIYTPESNGSCAAPTGSNDGWSDFYTGNLEFSSSPNDAGRHYVTVPLSPPAAGTYCLTAQYDLDGFGDAHTDSAYAAGRKLTIDRTAPTVGAVSTSYAGETVKYVGKGDVVTLVVPVTDINGVLEPTLTLRFGASTDDRSVRATSVTPADANGMRRFTFAYTIQSGDSGVLKYKVTNVRDRAGNRVTDPTDFTEHADPEIIAGEVSTEDLPTFAVVDDENSNTNSDAVTITLKKDQRPGVRAANDGVTDDPREVGDPLYAVFTVGNLAVGDRAWLVEGKCSGAIFSDEVGPVATGNDSLDLIVNRWLLDKTTIGVWVRKADGSTSCDGNGAEFIPFAKISGIKLVSDTGVSDTDGVTSNLEEVYVIIDGLNTTFGLIEVASYTPGSDGSCAAPTGTNGDWTAGGSKTTSLAKEDDTPSRSRSFGDGVRYLHTIDPALTDGTVCLVARYDLDSEDTAYTPSDWSTPVLVTLDTAAPTIGTVTDATEDGTVIDGVRYLGHGDEVKLTIPTDGTGSYIVDALKVFVRFGRGQEREATPVRTSPTSVALVTNAGKVDSTYFDTNVYHDTQQQGGVRQRFTTGANPTGYTLTSFSLPHGFVHAPDYIGVNLRTTGEDQEVLAKFSVRRSGWYYTFTPSVPVALEANTTYELDIYPKSDGYGSVAQNTFQVTTNTNEDASSGGGGWTIADTHYRGGTAITGSLLMRVWGYTNPVGTPTDTYAYTVQPGDVGTLRYRITGVQDTAGNEVPDQTEFTEITSVSSEGYGDDSSWARRTKSADVLNELSTHRDWVVRVYVALNPNTSCDTLEAMKNNPNLGPGDQGYDGDPPHITAEQHSIVQSTVDLAYDGSVTVDTNSNDEGSIYTGTFERNSRCTS